MSGELAPLPLAWQRWGVQSDAPYLTYRAYCDECKREGVKPVGTQRFRALMLLRGLRLAPEDYGPIEKQWGP